MFETASGIFDRLWTDFGVERDAIDGEEDQIRRRGQPLDACNVGRERGRGGERG